MRTFILSFLLGVVLISCEDEKDVKALRKLFNQTQYDPSIIQNLPLYDSLKNIVVSHIDTIFKFRNSKTIVYNGKDSVTAKTNADFYVFVQTNEPNVKSIDELKDNLPAFLYPSVESIFNRLGKEKIESFGVWADSAVEITAKAFYSKRENADVAHTLIWKRVYAKNTDPEFFMRDTMIATKWTYQIYVDNHGR